MRVVLVPNLFPGSLFAFRFEESAALTAPSLNRCGFQVSSESRLCRSCFVVLPVPLLFVRGLYLRLAPVEMAVGTSSFAMLCLRSRGCNRPFSRGSAPRQSFRSATLALFRSFLHAVLEVRLGRYRVGRVVCRDES